MEYDSTLVGAVTGFLTTIGLFEKSSSSNDLWQSIGGGLRFMEAEVSNVFELAVKEVCIDFISATRYNSTKKKSEKDKAKESKQNILENQEANSDILLRSS